LQHVHRSGNLRHFDLDFAEVLLLRECRPCDEREEKRNHCSHGGEL
jgi:hypothetical protein